VNNPLSLSIKDPYELGVETIKTVPTVSQVGVLVE